MRPLDGFLTREEMEVIFFGIEVSAQPRVFTILLSSQGFSQYTIQLGHLSFVLALLHVDFKGSPGSCGSTIRYYEMGAWLNSIRYCFLKFVYSY